MRLLAAAVLLLQGRDRAELRTGLDTLYAGDFGAAAHYFETLQGQDSLDPAPLIFQAGAFIWWAAAKDSDDFERARIDSLLDLAIAKARDRPAGVEREFWLGTALGYRARERDLHGHAWGAAHDAKVMRDAYRRVLAADSTCIDCYLGLGLYSYGLARAGTFARLVAKLIGLGGGNARDGLTLLHRVAADGDLARVEGAWVLGAALIREAERDEKRGGSLVAEARAVVTTLASRYPNNPVFARFLAKYPAP